MCVISDAIPDCSNAFTQDEYANHIISLHENLRRCAGKEDELCGSRWKLPLIRLEAAGVDFASTDGAEDVGVRCLYWDFSDEYGAVFVGWDGSAIVFCFTERPVWSRLRSLRVHKFLTVSLEGRAGGDEGFDTP